MKWGYCRERERATGLEESCSGGDESALPTCPSLMAAD
jgi:hypothetical protein